MFIFILFLYIQKKRREDDSSEEEFPITVKKRKLELEDKGRNDAKEGEEEKEEGENENETNLKTTEDTSQSEELSEMESEDGKLTGEAALFYFEQELGEMTKGTQRKVIVLGEHPPTAPKPYTLKQLRSLDRICTDIEVTQLLELIHRDILQQSIVTLNYPTEQTLKVRVCLEKQIAISNRWLRSSDWKKAFHQSLALSIAFKSINLWYTNTVERPQVEMIMSSLGTIWSILIKTPETLLGVSCGGCLKRPKQVLFDFLQRFAREVRYYQYEFIWLQ